VAELVAGMTEICIVGIFVIVVLFCAACVINEIYRGITDDAE